MVPSVPPRNSAVAPLSVRDSGGHSLLDSRALGERAPLPQASVSPVGLAPGGGAQVHFWARRTLGQGLNGATARVEHFCGPQASLCLPLNFRVLFPGLDPAVSADTGPGRVLSPAPGPAWSGRGQEEDARG